jgi:hypothetical protein
VEIEDLESGATVVSNATTARQHYVDEMSRFLGRWRSRCARLGVDYTQVVTDMPLEVVLRSYLLQRSQRVAR